MLRQSSSLRCLPLDLSSALDGSRSLVQQGHFMESFCFFTQNSRSHKSVRSDSIVAARIIQKTAENQKEMSNLLLSSQKKATLQSVDLTFVQAQVISSGGIMHRNIRRQMCR